MMLIIWELTPRSKLGSVLTLQARLGLKKDASMLRDIRDGIGWNILSRLMRLFAFLAVILNQKLEETFEECIVNQCHKYVNLR